LSYENLLKNTNISMVTDELVTALNVYGGGGLSIANVNPIGNATIYNFDYYMTEDWMSSTLIQKIKDWESLIAVKQPLYADLLGRQITYNSTLVTKQSELVALQGELLAMEGVRNVQIQQGILGKHPFLTGNGWVHDDSWRYIDGSGFEWTHSPATSATSLVYGSARKLLQN
jgi:hypothetical protein